MWEMGASTKKALAESWAGLLCLRSLDVMVDESPEGRIAVERAPVEVLLRREAALDWLLHRCRGGNGGSCSC